MATQQKLGQSSDIDIISDYSFKLALCELSLGSLLHAFRVPLAGQVLSLNQVLFMTLVTKEFKGRNAQARAPLYVSQVSALLKSLAPAGKKLGPMLSISMQGLLFVFPQYLLSTHILSIALGGALASLWAFIQPLVTLYILLGHNFIKAIEHYTLKVQAYFNVSGFDLWMLLLIPVVIKVLLAVGISVWAYRVGDSGTVSKILKLIMSNKIIRNNKQVKVKSNSLLKELSRPIFLISVFFTSLYIYTNKELLAPTVWVYLRPFAVGVLLIYINRSPFVIRQIERNQDKNFFQIFKRVNDKLKRVSL